MSRPGIIVQQSLISENVPEVLEDNSIGNVNNQVDDKYDISVNDELKSFKFKNIEDNNSLIFSEMILMCNRYVWIGENEMYHIS